MKITEILGTKYQDKSFKKEKDFFAKYFTRPFLTKKAIKHRPIKVKVNKKGLPENMDKIFKRDQLPQWTAKKLSQSDHNFVKKVVNFGTGKHQKIIFLAKKIKQLSKSKSKIIFIPARKAEVERLTCDASLCKKLTGWTPKVDIITGLKKNIEWEQKK